MIPEERRDRILSLLREEEVCSIKSLVSEFGVSRITIQRDLTMLEENGLLTKVHGGARVLRQESGVFETRFNIRYKQNYRKKLEIAKKALVYARPQGCIFIDSSTTAHVFGIEVFRQNIHDIVIVTNAPSLLSEATAYPDFKIISTGGELLRSFSMYAGEWVMEFLDSINIDCAFISAAGVSEELKITTGHRELSSILLKVIQKSAEVNLLMDSTKLFRQGMISVAGLSDCTRIIIDSGATEVQKNLLSRSGIEIV
ncbi:MAG: DeoR/GlpR family DNA-binding transcription regulator [Clostridiales bacterium]|nr:DeoR/GlpR family DNA-binding transcription regulator [Clostridiales bacterium]